MKRMLFLCTLIALCFTAQAGNDTHIPARNEAAFASPGNSGGNAMILTEDYARAKAERRARGMLDDVVTSLCNSLVCVQIDEEGDFNIGTADGRSLLYDYPSEPWSSDIEIYVDGDVWNLTSEHGDDCDGEADFINWTNNGTTIDAHYSIMGTIFVHVQHRPVLFSATTGAILTRTVVENMDNVPHTIGILYEYDTMVDDDDAAELFLGPTHLVNETCFQAPFATTYWDAVPSAGDLVGRGTFTGGDAITPDRIAFGQWGPLYDACWDYSCTNLPYSDSGVLYQWDEEPVAPGASVAAATYYGVGAIQVQPGDLQIGLTQPPLECGNGGVLPNPFELLVNVTNAGTTTCNNISVSMGAGAGPGGTGQIVGPNPQTIGTLVPGNNAAVSFTTMALGINAAGGCIDFTVIVTSDNCPTNTFTFCVELPACTCLFAAETFDMGDLAVCSYPTLTNNPAHGITHVAWLGDTVSAEAFPDGMNNDLHDDGVTYISLPWQPCQQQQVQVTVTGGPEYQRFLGCGGALYLSGWKDGNLDGDFCDTLCGGSAPEWIVQDVPVTPGTYTFTFTDPGVFNLGVYDGVFRWRLTSQAVGPHGFGMADNVACPNMVCGNYAVDFYGEVEDYIIADAQLDVALSSFEAVPGDGQVELRWVTASEIANERFEVLRGGETVARVPSQGEGASPREYHWTDRSAVNGTVYTYTLIAVDHNGNREHMGSVSAAPSAQAATITEYALHQNYPNPFNPSTEITFDLAEGGAVRLSVYNLLGQEVAAVLNRTMSAGRHVVRFDAESLPTGVYIYRLEANGFASQKKFVLLK